MRLTQISLKNKSSIREQATVSRGDVPVMTFLESRLRGIPNLDANVELASQ